MDKPKLLSYSLIGLLSSLLLLWGMLEVSWRLSTSVEIPIAAFQARNWLYGEHLLYSVQLESEDSCKSNDTYACTNPVSFSNNRFGQSCVYQLRGHCRGEHFLTPVKRFYLLQQNRLAKEFPHYYQKGTMKVKVSRLGPVFVEDFNFALAQH